MIDPATALYVVNGICWPVVKLGGLGASYVGPMLGFTSTAGVAAGMQAATVKAAGATVTVASSVGVLPTIAIGAVTYGAYKLLKPW